MTLYAAPYVLGTILGLYMVWDLRRMRQEAQRMLRDAEAYQAEAQHLYEQARTVYADSAARWMSLVRLEGRVH
jgi:uncharacterized membrane protein